MPFDPDAGDPSANSYLTVAEANAYFALRLHASLWSEQGTSTKEAALVMATRTIDARTCFTGAAASATQALKWPRSGMVDRNGNAIASNVVPQQLKDAVCELALTLLSGDVTAEGDAQAAGLSRLKAGPVELEFSETFSQNALPTHVTRMMVPSWLCPDDSTAPTFEAL